MIYSKIVVCVRVRVRVRVCVGHHLTAGSCCTTTTPPPPNPPAAKFASQGDVHVRTEAQIKFLYYPVIVPCHTQKTLCIVAQKIKNLSFIQSCKLLTYKAVDSLCHILTHYSPVLLFYTPGKHQKTFRLLTCCFSIPSGGIEKQHQAVVG